MIALMVPPFPAASRPSNTTITRSSFLDHPILQLAQFRLKLAQKLFVFLALHLRFNVVGSLPEHIASPDTCRCPQSSRFHPAIAMTPPPTISAQSRAFTWAFPEKNRN